MIRIKYLAIATATLVLLEVQPLRAIVLVVALFVVAEFGNLLLNQFVALRSNIGVTLTVGLSFLVFGVQILLLLGVPAYAAHWSILGVMALSSLMLNSRRMRSSAKFTGLKTAYAIALVVFSARHPWVGFFTMPLLGLQWTRFALGGRCATALKYLLPTLGWMLSFQLRPDRWWYFYQDTSNFYTAISWSISHWGVTQHPGSLEGSLLIYHWFSYGIFGALTHIAAFDTWDATMKVAPFLLNLLLALTIIGGDGEHKKLELVQSLLVALALLSLDSTLSDSLGWSFLFALVFLTLTKKLQSDRSVRAIALLQLMATALVLTKVTSGLSIAGILVLWWLIARLKRESFNPTSIAVLITALTSFALLSRFAKLPQATWLLEQRIDLLGSFGILATLLNTSAFLVAVALAAVFMSKSWQLQKFGDRTLLVAVVGGCTWLVLITVARNNPFDFYFPEFSLPLIALVGAQGFATSQVPDAFRNEVLLTQQFSKLVIYASLSVIGFIYLPVLTPLGDSVVGASSNPYVLIVVDTLVATLPYLVLCGLIIAITATKAWTLPKINVALLALMSLCLGTLSYKYWYETNVPRSASEESPSNDPKFPDSDLKNVARFIRSNTDSSVILASNNFWSFGDGPTPMPNSENCPEFGSNYLLPAESRRRFFMQGISFQGICSTVVKYSLTAQDLVPLTLSTEFANQPSLEVADSLRSFGVSGYVVNLDLTSQRDWSPFAREVYRSGRFVYLELVPNI